MSKPNTKDLFRGLDAKASAKPVTSEALAHVQEMTKAAAQRQGKKVVTYYLGPAPFMQLKVLAAKTGLTLQELNLEALNLLFEKYQVSRIAS
jgi:hypothetical protein